MVIRSIGGFFKPASTTKVQYRVVVPSFNFDDRDILHRWHGDVRLLKEEPRKLRPTIFTMPGKSSCPSGCSGDEPRR